MKHLYITFLFVFLTIFSISQEMKPDFAKNGETYFKFQIESPKILPDLTRIISIDNRNENTVYAYANESEFEQFLKWGIEYDILPHPNMGFNPVMATFEQIQNGDAMDYYPTYDAYVSMMYQFETDYPDICDVFSIGQSVNGREILVAKISDNVNTDEAEPEFLYTSSMHGDELTGYPLMLNLIDSLLSQYNVAPRITSLVNDIEIYINPLANPDGAYYGGNGSVSQARRYNANNYDLNRNFPDILSGQNPNTQPETFAFMQFAEDRRFVMATNFHGGAEVCNYPWDRISERHADDDWWQFVCHEYADTAQTYSPSGYMNGFDDGITNGWDWYTTEGCRQDYMNYFHHCREFTAEISAVKLVPASQLEDYWEYNRRSLLNYIEQVKYGVTGIVTDAITGLPVEAEVFVLTHEEDNSWVFSDPVTGNYHRLLIAETYDIQFSAPCYETQVIQNVVVQNYVATVVDVQLQPNSSAVDFSANSTSIITGGNVEFTDQSCGSPFSWEWTITGPGTPLYIDGTNSNSQNPIVQFNEAGSYDVSLTTTSAAGTFTETKSNYINVTSCSYCDIYYSNTSDDYISNLTFNTIDNDSESTNYSDFTAISTSVIPGSTYNLSVDVTVNGSWVQHTIVWIDWDRNCIFGDSGETYDLGQTPGSSGTYSLSADVEIPLDAILGATRMRVAERYSQNPGPCDDATYGEGEDYTIIIENPIQYLDLKICLEGPFNGVEMNTNLSGLAVFPLSQPYSSPPWNYSGTESVPSIPNSDIVDWVLLELRDAASAELASSTTTFARMAGFVLKDGSIVDMDGFSSFVIPEQISQNLFVVVRHRNHLDMMSANSLEQESGIFSYDFTDALSDAYLDGQKELGNGVFGMIGGDCNGDGQIDSADKIDEWIMSAGHVGYFAGDLNMDSQVNNPDKTDVWDANLDDNAQLPEEPVK